MRELDPKMQVAAALDTHRRELKRYVASRVAPEDVEDVLQIAALRAIEKADDLRDQALALRWLYRVHANIITDLGRKIASDRRLKQAMADAPEPVTAEVEPVCGCSIVQARKLSPNYAAIIDLVDIAGVSLTQAAEALNISVNNATVRLHRARAALKKQLLEHCGTTSAEACNDCRCAYEGCCNG
ncbi:MAG: sigma-70 family RNA polymerase sigma factor [Pseudomonadota bacterium]